MGSVGESTFTIGHNVDVDILIIGGGLSGLYSLYDLRRLNPQPSIKLVEAASDFGGVWYHNRYPGARVDSEWPIYQFSIPEVYQDFTFTQRFPDHNEVRRYIMHMDQVLGLRKDAIFNTIIDHVQWHEATKKWISRASRHNRTFRSKYLIICSGSSYKKHLPDFKGLETFAGQLLHSAAFPASNEEGDTFGFAGKRVGVIGNGATGVQIVQELGKIDSCQLTNFIRTPNTALPMRQRNISSKENEAQNKRDWDSFFQTLRGSHGGFPVTLAGMAFKDAGSEYREQILEAAWSKGGFAFLTDNFREFLADKEVNAYVYNFWARKTRERVKDPVKRGIVAPLTQKNPFGAKRCSLETDYFESLDRPNVTLVNLKESPIHEITEKGVVTENGKLYEFDVLILATGYDALTGSQMALGLHDRSGIDLREKWKRGTKTWLGLTIPDMPNLFMSYGPQAPTALANGPPIIEMQVEWIRRAIQKIEDEGIETVEPCDEYAQQWRKEVNDIGDKTLLASENSWWVGANVPGKVREHLNYMGGLPKYSEIITEVLDNNFRGFDIVRKTEVKE